MPGAFSGDRVEIHRVIRARHEIARRDVVAAPGWRRIVILRFFVGGVLVNNPGNSPMDALFGNAPLGTKGVTCISGNRPEATMSGSRDQNRIQPVDPDHATGAIRRTLRRDTHEIRAGAESVSRSCDCASSA